MIIFLYVFRILTQNPFSAAVIQTAVQTIYSAGHGQFFYSTSFRISGQIYPGTFPVFSKGLFCLFFITVNLPAANTFAALRFVFHKSADIFRRIPEKQTYFMGKSVLLLHLLHQLYDTLLRTACTVPSLT